MTRIAADIYNTPPKLAATLVSLLPIERGQVTLEPSCGSGSFVRPLLKKTEHVWALDTDPGAAGLKLVKASRNADFLRASFPDAHRPHWIVGNPPYTDVQDHIQHALDIATVGVAYLLRINLLAARKRVDFWNENNPHTIYIVTPRPSFTHGGNDMTEYGFYVWRRDLPPPPGTKLIWITGPRAWK